MINIFENFGIFLTGLHKSQKLAAIWIMEGIVTATGKERRIAAGMQIEAANGLIIDLKDKPTHEVLECHGTLTNQFEFVCRNLTTGNIETVKYISK